ncbi:MAG: histone deacetylase [Candidatus Bathyarchaeota archaeon]|nr:histone deacetylase [Candidatus Bathyarchaeota archaeon]
MKKTVIVYSPRYLDHNPGPSHPESPRRLQAIMEGIRKDGLLENESFSLVEPSPACLGDLELVHRSEYIRFAERFSESGGGILDEETETIASPESFEVARLAAGGAMEAVEKVMTEEFRNAFVLARPPGHHAGPGYAFGFCIFNNVALAAEHLFRRFGLERVLILDIDVHHGNGTQEIFYGTDRVLYISLHEDPSEFPGTGFISETGEGEGSGYTVNVPLPFETGDSAYWKAIKSVVAPIVRQYRPQFFLVSAGFDGYYRDRVGELSLSAYIYPRVFQSILDLAHQVCEDRLVAVLEGGYRLRFLKKTVPAIIAQMAGLNARIRDRRPSLNLSARKEAENAIDEVRKIQSSFWML